MISIDNLLSGNAWDSLPEIYKINLYDLQLKLNKFEKICPFEMTVTSGFRNFQHHLEVYAKKGIVPPNVPTNSKHLVGQAADISDPSGSMKIWLKMNVPLLEQNELWCEDLNSTPTWIHFQTVPPKSGNRFFIP
jgi:hypothetical protein